MGTFIKNSSFNGQLIAIEPKAPLQRSIEDLPNARCSLFFSEP
jgi:hypothetical protein